MSRRVGRNGRCKMHGMNAGTKPGKWRKATTEEANPLTSMGAGRYSGVNKVLRDGMVSSLNLEKQLSLKPDIAFVDAVIQELSTNLEEVIDRKTLGALRYVVSEFNFLREDPPDKQGDHLARLQDIMGRIAYFIESASSYEANKHELMRIQNHRMRLAEAQGKQEDRDAESMRKDIVLAMTLHFADGVLERIIQTEEQLENFQDILGEVRERYAEELFRGMPALTASNITPTTEAPIPHIDEEVIDAEWEEYQNGTE